MSKQQSRNSKTKPGKETTKKPTIADKLQASLLEIVPGKFNENDWNMMLEIDDSQEFIWELIDEVVDNSIKLIFEKYVEKQCIPYTINEAKKAILHIIDWQFVSKDKNDDAKEFWYEDEEPETCMIDSWAQGYVQSVFVQEEKKTEEEKETLEEKSSNNLGFLEELNRIINDPKENKEQTDRIEEVKVLSNGQIEMPKAQRKPKPIQPKPIKPAENCIETLELNQSVEDEKDEIELRMRMRTKPVLPEIKQLEESISKAPASVQTVLKSLLSRPAALREIEIDTEGNIQSIGKLDFENMPSTSVKTRFSVISELKPNQNVNVKKPLLKNRANQIKNETNASSKSSRFRKSPPPKKTNFVIDEDGETLLEPVPGVVFTMLSSTRVGPKKVNFSIVEEKENLFDHLIRLKASISNRQQEILDKSEGFLKPVKPLANIDSRMDNYKIEKIAGHVESQSFKESAKFKTIDSSS